MADAAGQQTMSPYRLIVQQNKKLADKGQAIILHLFLSILSFVNNYLMYKTIYLSLLSLFMTMNSIAQTSSLSQQKEVKAYLNEALHSNFFYLPSLLEKNDSFFYKQNKQAFELLNDETVNVFKIYSLCLFKKIDNYDFADTFDQYFYLDIGSPRIVFFKNDFGLNQAFASTYPIKSGSKKLKPISSEISLPEYNFYLNWKDNKNTFLTLAFAEFFIVKENCLYILKDDKIEKASDYFKAHSDDYPVNKLTNAFLGFKEGLYSKNKK